MRVSSAINARHVGGYEQRALIFTLRCERIAFFFCENRLLAKWSKILIMKKTPLFFLLVFFFLFVIHGQAQTIQLGLSLDASSSTEGVELEKFKDGVVKGIENLKKDGTIELTISQFRSAAIVIFGPKIIDSDTVLQEAIAAVNMLDPNNSLETSSSKRSKKPLHDNRAKAFISVC